jgi:murein DD-endopeptidase MepM/ murein hydrolase activator NlpD
LFQVPGNALAGMRKMSSQIRVGALVRVGFALLGASALAGCSSDSQRFQSLYASVQPQQIQPVALANQAMPGVDTTMSTGSIAGAGVRPLLDVGQRSVTQQVVQKINQPLLAQPVYADEVVTNGSAVPVAVKRTVIAAPVTPARKAVEPISIPKQVAVVAPIVAPKPKLQPVALKKPAVLVDPVETGSVITPPKVKTAPQDGGGWSAVNGTQVTLREGETVYNLSRRFGVPASEILRVNGIAKAGSVQTGQQLVIPTYQYSADAGVSAPDNNPETAIAKGSRGTVFDIPANKIPAPSHRPDNQVALLPTVPQPKTKSVDKMATGSVASQAPDDLTAKKTAKVAPVDQPLAIKNDGNYKVASGDSLHAIAKKTGVSVGQLRAANGLTDQSIIKVGQVLNLPKSTTDIASNDGVDTGTTGKRKSLVSKPSGTDATVTASIDPKQSKPKVAEAPATNVAKSAPTSLRWPAQGKVVTAFHGDDNGKPNDGIDIAMPAGTSVKAAEGGTVIYAGNGLAEFGNTVLIRHDNGLVTVYGHADKINVQRNQKVSKGDVIALSGASGKTKMPKLHFEVRKNSVPVDPSKYLQ